ncbi:hypothetical protein MUS1_03290 [Marinomonas ushuaiensis DSM 15871]|uniref:Uncharacterized protein n=1 Tax=Marinomonas ushuaiensis DSM 15871 TaxID=1122207 RepID=X7E9T0_9GAMM|nr:hypothetical protein MUS1_03290 [Marinomonas ushuaiensis DSM 15871]
MGCLYIALLQFSALSWGGLTVSACKRFILLLLIKKKQESRDSIGDRLKDFHKKKLNNRVFLHRKEAELWCVMLEHALLSFANGSTD